MEAHLLGYLVPDFPRLVLVFYLPHRCVHDVSDHRDPLDSARTQLTLLRQRRLLDCPQGQPSRAISVLNGARFTILLL